MSTFSQCGKCFYRNHQQLNDLFQISLVQYYIINAVSECYTKWISYFSV